jgi:hypothetical protein
MVMLKKAKNEARAISYGSCVIGFMLCAVSAYTFFNARGVLQRPSSNPEAFKYLAEAFSWTMFGLVPVCGGMLLLVGIYINRASRERPS